MPIAHVISIQIWLESVVISIALFHTPMAKTAGKSLRTKPKHGSTAGKLSKLKLKQKSKITKVQISKLNNDNRHITEIHKTLAQLNQPVKQVGAFDVEKLKSDIEKDEQRKKASQELEKQLEMMTGMAL